MPRSLNSSWVAWLAIAVLAAGCGGAAGGLVVVPPEVEAAKVPEGKYGSVHAIYLYDIGYVHFDPVDIGNTFWPSYATSRFTKIKLLTRVATHDLYGSIFIYHYGDLYDIGASVIKPDGTVQELTKNDIIKSIYIKDVVPDATPPINYCRTALVFPGLMPGDVIAYHYTKRGRSELGWQLNKLDAPVMFSKFMVARPPTRTEIQPVITNRQNLNIDKASDKGIATGMAGYTGISRQATYDIWTARNIPPITWEAGMPPETDLSSGVRLWQGSRKWDWNTLGSTYYKWFTHYGRYPGKAKELAQKITKGIDDRTERARAIYHWVKNNFNIVDFDTLTYVPREQEIETIDIDKMIEEKDAYPEKIASLMWLMLQAADVNATLVLATHEDNVRALEDLPDLYQFTYPLLALDDKTFLDTTNRLCPFGMVPWFFEGRKALWIKEGSVAFKKIPESAPMDNLRQVGIVGEVEPDGNAKVNAKISMNGQMAYGWRKWLAPMNPREREDAIRSIATFAAEKAEVDKFTLNNVDDVEKPLQVLLDYHVPGLAEVLQDKMVMKLGAFIDLIACPRLTHSSGNPYYICPTPTSDIRKNPVKFPFRRLDDLNISISFPKGFLLQVLPKGFRTRKIDKGTSLGIQNSYGTEGGKNLKVIRKLSVNDEYIDAKGYPKLRDMMRRFLAQKDTLITLELPKMND